MKYFLGVLSLLICSLSFSQVDQVIDQQAFRSIGPAFMTGRIADVAKDPNNKNIWYVAVASGGVFKTSNNGTTWDAVFEDYPVYTTGALAIDPITTSTVWLGTGENQSQRSVGWGDGVYKSLDGGETWKNMGLKNSEHIGKILIDPRDPNVVYVAAQGPLWKSGGDRGVYKTTDGGRSWTQVLQISEDTGVADLTFDPENPDVIYAASYQRRRHVGILVAGGPEARIYKSTNAGSDWRMLSNGLPGGDLGRIAIAVSPQKNNVVYALISGDKQRGGFYRSENYGESWKKQSDYQVVDPQYYGEIYCDPHRFDHVYAVDMMAHHTADGGKTFTRVNSRSKHVDNHAILFDEDDPDYIMIGSDGGIYESWDRTKTWRYISNLPIMQFYRVGIDNAFPFYNVYGGTQDNSSIYGPSQTTSIHGINNHDWTLMLGGDGFQARVDPEDENIVYTQYQYAGIVRYDKRTGQRIDIQPQPGMNDDPLRWHWDSPLIISPHDSKTLYYAAQKLFKSTDRGDSWQLVSGDLSRGEDRNDRKVMGMLWQPEAVWKNVFTSPYGTIVSLSESPVDEGVLVVGTDDGLVQVSEDGGASWARYERFEDVPAKSYVADVFTSNHDRNTIYAVLNNHKEGDFRPYVVKSENLGKTWKRIDAGIASDQSSWVIMEDHLDPDLLFVGTEFGLWVSVNGGTSWKQMKNGLPTVAVRDLEIQKRENDLVLATFGRGFYILDDYRALRELSNVDFAKNQVFEVGTSWSFFEKGNLGYSPQATFGNNFYVGDNPGYGTRFTVYLNSQSSRVKERRSSTAYPSYDQLQDEDTESGSKVFLKISDGEGKALSMIGLSDRKGAQTVYWDHRTRVYEGDQSRQSAPVNAGVYSAQIIRVDDNQLSVASDPQTFEIKRLNISTEAPADDYFEFYQEVAREQLKARRAIKWVGEELDELASTTKKKVLLDETDGMKARYEALQNIKYQLEDNPTLKSRSEYYLPGIASRLSRIYYNQYDTDQVTQTQRDQLKMSAEALDQVVKELGELGFD